MRRVRYVVATSLDGYIAGPDDDYDWIPTDPAIDFESLFDRFDTVVMGRRTYDVVRESGRPAGMPGMKTYVFSTTLSGVEDPDVVLSDDAVATVASLRGEPGKDVWLFGGGLLFRSLVEARLVDAVEVAVCPVLLGGGLPVFPTADRRIRLELTGQRRYPSGIVSLTYDVVGGAAPDAAPGEGG